MINYLALLGWNDGSDNEIFTRDELIDAFDLNRVVKSPSVFDIEKLKWVNAQHLKIFNVEQIIPYVIDQMKWEGLIREEVSLEDPNVRDFAYASTALAKQMMETTKDAVLNAKTVVSYNLPASFDQVKDEEAKAMIQKGSFYPLAMKVLQQYEAGELPMPDTQNPLAAFQDASGEAIEEDDKKGETCVFTHDYMAHMKSLAKEMKLKGKMFFHPLRLMLTGEMSGQDVTKQLSLLALATREGNIIDKEKAGVVDIPEF
jgi:glutamyl-tRNA synthetase